MKREVEIYECGCVWAPSHHQDGMFYQGYLVECCPEHYDPETGRELGPYPSDPHHHEVWGF